MGRLLHVPFQLLITEGPFRRSGNEDVNAAQTDEGPSRMGMTCSAKNRLAHPISLSIYLSRIQPGDAFWVFRRVLLPYCVVQATSNTERRSERYTCGNITTAVGTGGLSDFMCTCSTHCDVSTRILKGNGSLQRRPIHDDVTYPSLCHIRLHEKSSAEHGSYHI